MRFREELYADASWYIDDPSVAKLAWCVIRHRTFRPVFSLRLVQAATRWNGLLGRAAESAMRILHRRTCHRAGVDLPATTRVGPGFKITHGWGLTISPDATIGRSVVAMHGVTIGGRGRDRAPTIGDGVLLGPGCAVLGAVTVGAEAVINANCVVVDDVASRDVLVAPTPVTKRRRPRGADAVPAVDGGSS